MKAEAKGAVMTPAEPLSAAHVHDYHFDGDDPYLVCGCGARRDALTGRATLAAREPAGAGLDVELLARALGPVIEESLTWLQLWRFDRQDEDPWPDLAAAIAREYARLSAPQEETT